MADRIFAAFGVYNIRPLDRAWEQANKLVRMPNTVLAHRIPGGGWVMDDAWVIFFRCWTCLAEPNTVRIALMHYEISYEGRTMTDDMGRYLGLSPRRYTHSVRTRFATLQTGQWPDAERTARLSTSKELTKELTKRGKLWGILDFQTDAGRSYVSTRSSFPAAEVRGPRNEIPEWHRSKAPGHGFSIAQRRQAGMKMPKQYVHHALMPKSDLPFRNIAAWTGEPILSWATYKR
ncbi:hypothetical protein M011DRAFT_481817 [Sporormia fimetaria CBS 119925]|uniref:Uncharacterized protein n=1 Tax=Sporormia fimetaria CBS 119925 TaxID=1340428 RepID=A0A6A6UX38_9PLEO|nr:hypothetical protein M011DRAFT_481817 [Sporormia fimetaria CBS 119925]